MVSAAPALLHRRIFVTGHAGDYVWNMNPKCVRPSLHATNMRVCQRLNFASTVALYIFLCLIWECHRWLTFAESVNRPK